MDSNESNENLYPLCGTVYVSSGAARDIQLWILKMFLKICEDITSLDNQNLQFWMSRFVLDGNSAIYEC